MSISTNEGIATSDKKGFEAWWKSLPMWLSFFHRWVNKYIAELAWNSSRIEMIKEELANIEKAKSATNEIPHRLTITWLDNTFRTIECLDHSVIINISDWFSGVGEDAYKEVLTFISHSNMCDSVTSLRKSDISTIDLVLMHRDGNSVLKDK